MLQKEEGKKGQEIRLHQNIRVLNHGCIVKPLEDTKNIHRHTPDQLIEDSLHKG
jgi:hypothetical protein